METGQVVAVILAAFVLLLPFLWGLSTWLWLRARWKLRVLEARERKVRFDSEEALKEWERNAELARSALEQERNSSFGLTAALAEKDSQLLLANDRSTDAARQLVQLRERFSSVTDVESELQRVLAQVRVATEMLETTRQSYADKKSVYDRLAAQVAVFDDRLAFAELGVYEPHFDFTDSGKYKAAIAAVRDRQKRMISDKTAVYCPKQWTMDGSASKGATMVNRSIKLTLRAFNNECEAAIANARWNNVGAMEKRIQTAKNQIESMNASLDIRIDPQFLAAKLEELFLTHEYREKLKFEKEERAEAARLAREEQRLLRDLEKAEEDEARYEKLLAKARAEAASIVGEQLDTFTDQIKILERDLADAHAKAERAKALAERTRTGWVYIISNIGSFGEGIVKIGLTRRLDPMDRIRELGDASVPFAFDIHAMVYSDDAPALERALHSIFEPTRINTQNYRKEFFWAELDDVENAVRHLAPDASFFRDVEAQEYRETMSRRASELANQTAVSDELFPSAI